MAQNWGCCAPSFFGKRGPHLTQCRLSEVYLRTKRHLNPSSHLATTDMERKLGVVSLFGEGGLGPYLKQCGWGRGLHPCQVYS